MITLVLDKKEFKDKDLLKIEKSAEKTYKKDTGKSVFWSFLFLAVFFFLMNRSIFFPGINRTVYNAMFGFSCGGFGISFIRACFMLRNRNLLIYLEYVSRIYPERCKTAQNYNHIFGDNEHVEQSIDNLSTFTELLKHDGKELIYMNDNYFLDITDKKGIHTFRALLDEEYFDQLCKDNNISDKGRINGCLFVKLSADETTGFSLSCDLLLDETKKEE